MYLSFCVSEFWPLMTLIVDDLQVMNLIGDVKGKVAIMVDDMIDTAGRDSLQKLRV